MILELPGKQKDKHNFQDLDLNINLSLTPTWSELLFLARLKTSALTRTPEKFNLSAVTRLLSLAEALSAAESQGMLCLDPGQAHSSV